jgi:acetylornithine/N-succinyldiaminopimelate aminotransferase
MGRTGKLFAHEWAGVTPDVMSLAKGLGGGFPVGACLTTEAAGAPMTAGSHGSTFGGNPLAMAAANTVLDVLQEDGFLENVRHMGDLVTKKADALIEAHRDVFEGVRGTGLLIGLKCKVTNMDLVASAQKNGLLIIPAGDNVVRLIPPLIIDETHVAEAFAILDKAAAQLAG